MFAVGIVGHGPVGQALTSWLAQHNSEIAVKISDPAKGFNDDLFGCDAYFVQIHVPTETDGTQDISQLRQIIAGLPADKPIWIRTTILPGTSRRLAEETGRIVWHMPEFLTQRTSVEDFEKQVSVFTGDVETLKKIFPGKRYIVMSSEEAELAKYAHNVFGAMKVIYFNCVMDLCEREGLDYASVLNGILASGYINREHTAVPGPDGMFGYGGKCFPKDVHAMAAKYENTPFGELISPIEKLNARFRKKEIQ